MKAARLTGLRQFDVIDVERAEPAPGEVRIHVAAVGICGSDMHNFTEGGIGDSPCQFPMVLGHEPSGVVDRIGSGVNGISVGDHFALEPAIPCGTCEWCLTGHANLCDNMVFLSSKGVPGFFREYVNLPAHNLIPIPKNVGLKEATLIEPLAVALHSLHFARVQAGESAVVFGAGPIGLLTIAALKQAGAGRVWVVEPIAHRREMARAMGADAVVDLADSLDTGRGADLAFDCAGKRETMIDCIHALAKCGRLIYTAIPAEIDIPVFAPGMRKKEIAIFNVYRSNHQTENARDMLARNAKHFAPLITHARPLDEIQKAFELNVSYADGVGKMILTNPS